MEIEMKWKTQDIKPWFWERFIDERFIDDLLTESEESLEKFLEDLNKSILILSLHTKNPKRKLTF